MKYTSIKENKAELSVLGGREGLGHTEPPQGDIELSPQEQGQEAEDVDARG